ncbi:MAG TPA: cysteine desulfurase NifS [Phycisphaerales bacterium]|nr:cysteine desulfurase NifS [Phycisphaerales bacterium]|tara:strand:+ start:32 stop:1216 length:1185 start_codon:yes stop_codon:yes gene_type:complete
MDWIYLDNNATTQPADEVTAKVNEANEQFWANPSSVHRLGQMVRQQLELARTSVARLIGARPREIFFTSGGTEANNLALRGSRTTVIFTSLAEHAAVREPAEKLAKEGVRLVMLQLNSCGIVEPKTLQHALENHVQPDDIPLVSLQWANNETGMIQPISELIAAAHAHEHRVAFHVDATQVAGKLPMDVHAMDADMLTLAGHKFHGPKGVGALYVRRGIRLEPQILGGPQEREQRGGTENVPAILGMGVAADLAYDLITDSQRIQTLSKLRNKLEQTICQSCRGAVINPCDLSVPGEYQRLWNTTNLGFPKLEAEAILLMLSEKGICASAGAACSSGSLEPSPVLLAIGVPPEVAHGSVRLSLSRYTTEDQIDRACQIIPQVITKLRKVSANVI